MQKLLRPPLLTGLRPAAKLAPVKRVRTYHEVEGSDASALGSQVAAQAQRVAARLATVRHVAVVMSGKGGVGKSFVAAGLATALARRSWRVGVLDGDLHAPTAARMLGASRGRLAVGETGVAPATTAEGIRVMSSDLLLEDGAPLKWREPQGPGFVWRGALEAGMLREFLSDVAWGELDLLLVDLPPGTERFDALRDLVPRLAGALVVTIPSEASYQAVKRALGASAGVSILGVIENMSGQRCASCRAVVPLFGGNAGDRLAAETGSRVIARIPFDPALQVALEGGGLAAAAEALSPAADAVASRLRAS
jgi:ATP-binding protein involved in chromosome partitioning